MRQGQRVEQGQRVGAVGMTGWTTGPHLHFEFRVDGQHQDPLSVAKASESRAAGHRGPRRSSPRSPAACRPSWSWPRRWPASAYWPSRPPDQARSAIPWPGTSGSCRAPRSTASTACWPVTTRPTAPSCNRRGHVGLPMPETLRAELLALNQPGPNELHRAALAANGVSELYAEAVARLLAQTGAGRHRRDGHRRPRPDRAPPPAGLRRHRLHAATAQRRTAGRTHRHRRGVRLPQPRPGGRRPGRAAGAGLSRRLLRSAGRRCRGAEPGRHRQPHAAARRRRGAGLRLRPRQPAHGPVVPSTPGRRLRRGRRLGGGRSSR